MKIYSTITHRNGGIEQGFLQIMSDEGILTDSDKKWLEYLKSLPQNRTEILYSQDILIKEERIENARKILNACRAIPEVEKEMGE